MEHIKMKKHDIKKSRRVPFAHGSDPCREYLGEKNCR